MFPLPKQSKCKCFYKIIWLAFVIYKCQCLGQARIKDTRKLNFKSEALGTKQAGCMVFVQFTIFTLTNIFFRCNAPVQRSRFPVLFPADYFLILVPQNALIYVSKLHKNNSSKINQNQTKRYIK